MKIGRQLAASETGPNAKDRDAKIEQRSLGYGNRGMLLAPPFNVPTQTLIPFWAGGIVDGIEWLPLLPRQKKQ